MTRVMGMDPSLRGFGIAYRLNDTLMTNRINTEEMRGFDRIVHLESVIERHIERVKPDIVAYEDYALGYKGATNTIFNIGELGGVIKLLLLKKGIDILSVPPTTLKLFTTGKGGGKSKESKRRVADAMYEQTGLRFKNSDECDAAALLLLGESYANPRLLPRNRNHYRRRALMGCSLLRFCT